jgi:hypothetical protein
MPETWKAGIIYRIQRREVKLHALKGVASR